MLLTKFIFGVNTSYEKTRYEEEAFIAKLPIEKIEEKVILNSDTVLLSIPCKN